MSNNFNIFIKKDVSELLNVLPQILELADSQKEALGFLPPTALREGARRKCLMAAMVDTGNGAEFAGYLFHGGVFPHAKIQQIAVAEKFRRRGIAASLIKAFSSELERLGFLTIRADVASTLRDALSFYSKNRFVIIRQRAGGQARGRMILLHIRELETDNLFSFANKVEETNPGLGLRRRALGEMPFFAFDLNVYFDLVKDRAQSEQARRLFGAALGHDIRLVVANEFVSELQRTTKGLASDPILQMAVQLPRLPKVDPEEINVLAVRIHDIVFVQQNTKGAGSEQALSDSRHLAHAVLSRASGFITRDGPILTARNELLSNIGIDVVDPVEVLGLLPSDLSGEALGPIRGDGFLRRSISDRELLNYLKRNGVAQVLLDEFLAGDINCSFIHREAIWVGDQISAIGVLRVGKGTEPVARLLIHVCPEYLNSDMFADFILDVLVKMACKDGAISIELVHLPGQSSVNSLAGARGFFREKSGARYSKIAVGHPLTSGSWPSAAKMIRRRTGLILPHQIPDQNDVDTKISNISDRRFSLGQLEDMLSPTILIWPNRNGVIVPITRAYADDLLGTSRQSTLAFIANRDAAFLSRRAYVNSPRAAKQMRPNSPILFYESKGNGSGRGAVVAVARITDSVIVRKNDISEDGRTRLVVDDVEPFSASDDVLLTTFDNLFVIPRPVPLRKLKDIDAIGRANLISAVSLSSEKIAAILTQGWPSGKV